MAGDRFVTITAKPNPAWTPGQNTDDQYIFSMDEGFGATKELDFNKSNDGMWRWENYRIHFTLDNQDGANLKFSRDLNKVLWAYVTTDNDPPCPTSQQMTNTFWVRNQQDIEDLRLTVTNKDKDRQRFMFAFNFLPAGESDGPGANYVRYDPIGNNQNGGWPRSFAMIAPTTVGGTAVGAAVGALVSPLLNPEPTTMTYLLGALVGAAIGYAAGLVLGKPSATAARGAPH